MATVKPLLVIVGPTASGKTQLALDIAERYNGEIIAADSRTIYKGLDIGTAKPTRDDQQRVIHHLIDIVEPNEAFNVYRFQQLATKIIADIRDRGKLPILVGGTGLYIDSIIFDYNIKHVAIDKVLRAKLTTLSIEELQQRIEDEGIAIPENRSNPRYLIRAIEQKVINRSRRNEPVENTVVVGITTKKDILHHRIKDRISDMFERGVYKEAVNAARKYGWEAPGLSGNVYQVIRRLEEGEITRDLAVNLCIISDRQLAKRQLTWLRRNKFIQWLDVSDAKVFIDSTLN